jgi:uncharacterized HAD superfamily protein
MRVYVDMDDVLCQTVRSLVDVLHQLFGRRVAIEDIRDFELSVSFDLDRGQWEALMRAAHEPRVLESMHPVFGAREVLREWNAAGCELAVVTGRPPSSAEPSRRWLARHAIPHDRIDFVDKYGRSDWSEQDGHAQPVALEELAQQGFDLAVEDSRDMAVRLAGELGVPVALIDQPWNREPIAKTQGGHRVVRCRDWSDVRRHFPFHRD